MTKKIFIDTNILIYSIDKADRKKRKIARDLLREIIHLKSGVLSTQVLQEFYVASTRKLNAKPKISKEIINSFTLFEIVEINLSMINDAIDLSVSHKLSFWDSLIVISASYANCSTIVTEDLNHGQRIHGVEISNPF
ncbi:MAG: PIN domain-containing protein [Melioribacteraceae bacterium]|nr:PIN domain-containing protein [Melioribacteraceae bacterium]MCF8394707.1 PIN domain-containing protein [Melioribacteraceae bacterium]MCF8418092.1 PIN domain-containing protein [Melioribacteraceae bacterium]